MISELVRHNPCNCGSSCIACHTTDAEPVPRLAPHYFARVIDQSDATVATKQVCDYYFRARAGPPHVPMRRACYNRSLIEDAAPMTERPRRAASPSADSGYPPLLLPTSPRGGPHRDRLSQLPGPQRVPAYLQLRAQPRRGLRRFGARLERTRRAVSPPFSWPPIVRASGIIFIDRLLRALHLANFSGPAFRTTCFSSTSRRKS